MPYRSNHAVTQEEAEALRQVNANLLDALEQWYELYVHEVVESSAQRQLAERANRALARWQIGFRLGVAGLMASLLMVSQTMLAHGNFDETDVAAGAGGAQPLVQDEEEVIVQPLEAQIALALQFDGTYSPRPNPFF